MANLRTFFANAYETTLDAQLGPSGLTVSPVTLANVPDMPCYLAIEPDNPAQREYFLADAVSGSDIVIASIGDRYLAGSAASSNLTHAVGSVLKQVPAAQMLDDLHDRVDARLATSAHTKSLHDALEISHASLSDLTTGDPHTQYLNIARHDTTARHGPGVVEHSQIGGLGADDHPQYVRADGTRGINGRIFINTVEWFTAVINGGAVPLDFGTAPVISTAVFSSPLTFTTSNLGAGRWKTVRVVANTLPTAAMSFPAAWTWIGVPPPANILLGQVGFLSLVAYGSSDATVVAAWGMKE